MKHIGILVAAALAATSALTAAAQDISGGKWIDLTHPFGADTLYWPTSKRFQKEIVFAGRTPAGFYYSAYNFSTAEHGGTHMDAPVHFAEGALPTDGVPVSQLIGPGVVIDVSAESAKDVDYLVTLADIERHERAHGPIPRGAIVLIRTGRAKLYPDAEKYMGTAERGQEAVAKLHFPGLSKTGATALIKRGIGAVGIDTPSIDHGPSKTFAAHVTLMTRDIPALENVADMSALPPRGSTIIALPMKIKGGSGGPLRIVAHVPDG